MAAYEIGLYELDHKPDQQAQMSVSVEKWGSSKRSLQPEVITEKVLFAVDGKIKL